MRPATKADYRKRDLARIHCLKKELALDDENYRAMLKTQTGKSSSADMDVKQRYAVINHMKTLANKPKASVFMDRPASRDMTPQLGKIEAYLAEAKRPWSYVNSMSKRIFKVERVQWLHPGQLGKIIAALETDAQRHGRYTGK